MKWAAILFLLSSSVWAKPLVLVGHFDAFGNAPFNNSERIAEALARKLNAQGSPVEIKLCALNTIFAKAHGQFEDCLKALEQTPVLVLGLGESTCDLKIETIVRNKDKTKGPDNAGEERNNTVIIPEAPSEIGLRYPLPQMYCALPHSERKDLDVSNHAGSFVCNNTAFQMAHYYPELMFGFIHVPANHCRNLGRKNETVVDQLAAMLVKGVEFLETDFPEDLKVPHPSNGLRLPTKKKELEVLRRAFQKTDKCVYEYFKRSRGADEKGFWSFLGQE